MVPTPDYLQSQAVLTYNFPSLLIFYHFSNQIKNYGGCIQYFLQSFISSTYYNIMSPETSCTSPIAECSYCAQSQTSSACFICNNSFYLFNDPSTSAQNCVKDCPAGYYSNMGYCNACNSPCASCTQQPIQCTQCLNGLYLFQTSCLKSCPDGTFQSETSCIQCNPTCLFCADKSDNCTDCSIGTYLVKQGNEGTCLACDSLCSACSDSPTNCSSCIIGVFLRGNICSTEDCPLGYYQDQKKLSCQKCDSSCLTCSGTSSNCESCTSSYLFNNKCINKCPAGSYTQQTLQKCTICSQKNCIKCLKSPDVCTEFASCKANEYYSLSQSSCQECQLPCSTCNASPDTCQTCISPFEFFPPESSCLIACPQKYYYDNSSSQCLPCGQYCKTCKNSTTCQECVELESQQVILFKDTCTLECPTGYYLSNSACLACSASCLECDGQNSSSCTSCQEGKYLYNKECLKQCPSNYAANYSNRKCEKCSIDTLDQSTCSQQMGVRILTNNFNSKRLLLAFRDKISLNQSQIKLALSFSIKDIDSEYYYANISQIDPQALEIVLKFSEVILSDGSVEPNLNRNLYAPGQIQKRQLTSYNQSAQVLIGVNYVVEFSNSSLIVGTSTQSMVVSGLILSSSIPFILSDSLESKSKEMSTTYNQLLIALIISSALFVIMFPQFELLQDSIKFLQYIVIPVQLMEFTSPLLRAVASNVMKVLFYDISIFILEKKKNFTSSMLNEDYSSKDDSLLFLGSSVSSSNFIANLFCIFEWDAIIIFGSLLIQLMKSILSQICPQMKIVIHERYFMNVIQSVLNISFIPVIFYAFKQTINYQASLLEIVGFGLSLIIIGIVGFIHAYNIFGQKALQAGLQMESKSSQRLKVYIACLLSIYFEQQRDLVMILLIGIEIVDFVINCNEISKNEKPLWHILFKFLFNLIIISILSLFLVNDLSGEDYLRNHFKGVINGEIGLITLIIALIFIIQLYLVITLILSRYQPQQETKQQTKVKILSLPETIDQPIIPKTVEEGETNGQPKEPETKETRFNSLQKEEEEDQKKNEDNCQNRNNNNQQSQPGDGNPSTLQGNLRENQKLKEDNNKLHKQYIHSPQRSQDQERNLSPLNENSRLLILEHKIQEVSSFLSNLYQGQFISQPPSSFHQKQLINQLSQKNLQKQLRENEIKINSRVSHSEEIIHFSSESHSLCSDSS